MKKGVAPGTVTEGFNPGHLPTSNAMQSFVSRHQHQIQGTIRGLDRLRFMGSLRRLSFAQGLASLLLAAGVRLKDFGAYVEGLGCGSRQRSTTRPV
jgi:hypothetical protein